MIWLSTVAIILFFVIAKELVSIFIKIIKNKSLNNFLFIFIYLLNEGDLISPNGVNVILNINEFSDSNSESL